MLSLEFGLGVVHSKMTGLIDTGQRTSPQQKKSTRRRCRRPAGCMSLCICLGKVLTEVDNKTSIATGIITTSTGLEISRTVCRLAPLLPVAMQSSCTSPLPLVPPPPSPGYEVTSKSIFPVPSHRASQFPKSPRSGSRWDPDPHRTFKSPSPINVNLLHYSTKYTIVPVYGNEQSTWRTRAPRLRPQGSPPRNLERVLGLVDAGRNSNSGPRKETPRQQGSIEIS